MNKSYIFHSIIFCTFFILAAGITYPLIFNLGSLATGLHDELHIAWIHQSVLHNILTNPLHLFEGTMYYPYQHTLAYSDLFLTTSILTAPFVLWIGQPIAANNIVIISSLTLLGYGIYVLTMYLTKQTMVSVISGMLVMFSPAILDKVVHIQLLACYFVVFSFYFLFRYFDTGKHRYVLYGTLCFILQTYNSVMPGYFIVLGYGIIFFTYFITNRMLFLARVNKKVFITIFAGITMLLPIAIPYISVSREFSYVRDIRDTMHFALQPEDLWYPNQATRLEPILKQLSVKSPYGEEKVGYLGAVFSILTISTCIFFFKQKKRSPAFISLFVTGCSGLLLALGPFLHLNRVTVHTPFLIPLPYLPAYYLLPGFQAFRSSGRFEVLFILCIAVCVGIFLSYLIKRTKRATTRYSIYAVLIFGIFAEFRLPFSYVSVPQTDAFPQIYASLRQLPLDSVVIEMPIYVWNMQPYVFAENMRGYVSTAHFRRMVNGASGFSPDPWQQMVVKYLYTFPADETIRDMKQKGIHYILVHADEYDMLAKDQFLPNKQINGSFVLRELEKNTHVVLLKRVEKDYLFQIQ